MTAHFLSLSRRAAVAGGGALIIAFALSGYGVPAQDAPKPQPLPGDLKKSPFLDSWIRVDDDGRITIFTGKSELGQGIKTALRQIAAEELSVKFEDTDLITSDTARTADEGFTSGSQSMSDSGTAILHAAAQVRELLIGLAATKLGAEATTLKAEGGKIVAESGQSLVPDSAKDVTLESREESKPAESVLTARAAEPETPPAASTTVIAQNTPPPPATVAPAEPVRDADDSQSRSVASNTAPADRTLPQTAGYFPLMGVIGLVSLALAIAMAPTATTAKLSTANLSVPIQFTMAMSQWGRGFACKR